MANELYFTPARRKIDAVHIYTDTGATSAVIHINTHDSGATSLLIEAKDIEQGAAALNAFIKERDAMKRDGARREIHETGEETTTAYYDSNEGNPLLLYDPLDENAETDADGYII